MRVLIADDQKSVGTSLAEMVGLCHHQVVEVVGTGMEAIQAYDRHRPDVVLMDYRMPKLNGITACRYFLAGARRLSPRHQVQPRSSPSQSLFRCSTLPLPRRCSLKSKKIRLR